MATAEARICNRALARIGQLQQIVSLDQASAIARACKALYADSRDATLEARDWPFARRRSVLGAIADGQRGGWAYAYTLPADCIAPRYIEPNQNNLDDDDVLIAPADILGLVSGNRGIAFETEDDAALGRVLLTDQPDAELVYTARIEAVPRFTSTFVDALSYKLASDLALSVAKRPPLAEALQREFELTLARAAAASSKQQKPRRPPLSSFERNR
jgi:hypothetical protein